MFSIHLLLVGHLGCYHSLDIVNNAAINIDVQVHIPFLKFSIPLFNSSFLFCVVIFNSYIFLFIVSFCVCGSLL
jgi:hypothetical protein